MTDAIRNTSVRKICETFWEAEAQENLFSQKDDGVYFWRLVRFPLYYAASQKARLFDAAHPSSAFDASLFIRKIGLVLRSLCLLNPVFVKKKYENIVMPHPRKVGGLDIYTQELLEKLPYQSTLRLYNDYGVDVKGGNVANMFACAFTASIKRKICRLFFKGGVFTVENYALLSRVEKQFEEKLGIHLPVRARAELEKEMFIALSKGYKTLFKKTKAKRLYLTSAYTNCAAVHAARECGMEVIELQHGIFTRYHLGYSFPNGGDVPYFPDRLMCFGKFWPEATPLPTGLHIDVIGAPYIAKLSVDHPSSGPRRSVVFSSQGVIGAKLFEFASRAASLLPQENFIFRLHPSEILEEYEDRARGRMPPNLTLSHRSPNIFALLASAGTQVGVFSTTLFEGMVLGCKTMLIDMPGIEYMESVTARGDAILMKTPEEFAAALLSAPLCRDPDFYYDRAASLSVDTANSLTH